MFFFSGREERGSVSFRDNRYRVYTSRRSATTIFAFFLTFVFTDIWWSSRGRSRSLPHAYGSRRTFRICLDSRLQVPVTRGPTLTFGRHITGRNQKSYFTTPHSTEKVLLKLNLLELYVSILIYCPRGRPSSVPHSVEVIGTRAITGLPTIFENSVVRTSTNFNSIQYRTRAKAIFYEKFLFQSRPRPFSRRIAPNTKHKLEPYPFTWTH